jgi:predicted dehydrogenase
MTEPIVLVGAGNACRLWLPNVLAMPEVELAALVDVEPERAAAILAEHGSGETPVEADVAETIGRRRPSVVVDLTPPANREAVAAAAFAGGCDLIVEKPMADSVEAARRLNRLAESAGRRLAVMQNHRFHPALRALRQAVVDGTLGEPVRLDCELSRAVEPFDRTAEMPSPLLADMAIHGFDGARALLGRRPQRTVAAETRPPGSGFAGAAIATAVFEFEGGAQFSYRGSWAAAGLETPWFGDWRVDGTTASAIWRGDGQPRVERFVEHTPEGPRFERLTLDVEDGPNDHPAAVPALLREMLSGEPLETPGTDNILSLAMVEAAIASARSGGWVDVTG